MIQNEEKEPVERYDGLLSFCEENNIKHEYISTSRSIKKMDLFIVVKDRDLIDILKQAISQTLTPGVDFGIISYNDTPLKELLAGGITTLSTDFKLMGKTMAKLLKNKIVETVDNPWLLNLRKSL